ADLLQRRGLYPTPRGTRQDIPGLEFAGVVVDAPGSGRWQPGDRVMGLADGASQAEELVVDADTLMPIPDQLGFPDAAAIPEAFVTAWDAMVLQARTTTDEWLLVHAVGSGVGTAAVQLG